VNKILMLLLACWLAVSVAAAQPVRVDAVEAELVAASDAAVPGGTLMLGLRLRHDPHWHTYWRNPGDSGLPTRVELSLPEGWSAGEIAWPAPKRIFIGPLANYGYEDEVLLPVPVRVPAGAAPGEVRITARAQWLMCRDVCIPGEAELALPLRVAPTAVPSSQAALFEAAMAAGAREALPVRVGLGDGGRASLAFDLAGVQTAEFFPYAPALVSAPAPQRLFRLDTPGASGAQDTPGRWRLELALAEGVGRAALDKGGFLAGPVGVMRVDGRHYEVVAGPGEAGAGGVLVATAEGRDESRGAPQGGAASRFLEGVGGGSSAPAPGAVAAPGGGLTLAMAALFGVLGGLILNLMPCVFPVIGLKVLGFAGHGGAGAGAGGGEARRGALAFAAGVLASFWVLAALLLVLRGAGQAVGWGFQLQSPAFVAAMALLFVLIGLNFAGVFEFGLRLTRLGGAEAAVAGRGGLAGSFGAGVLAVLVATPCTAPFMGSALGYTLGRPAVEVFVVYAALALGMALP
jgi:thiol:disulfide interchange protein DsbD